MKVVDPANASVIKQAPFERIGWIGHLHLRLELNLLDSLRITNDACTHTNERSINCVSETVAHRTQKRALTADKDRMWIHVEALA